MLRNTTVGLGLAVFGLGMVAGIALVPSSASAARQAICDHPEGSRCVATRDTGRIECFCLDGSHELRNDDLPQADDEALMDACWDAWSMVCKPYEPTWLTCDAPGYGTCDVTGEEGGMADCNCESGDALSQGDVSALVGLEDEALEDACHEHLVRVCEPPPPMPAAAPPVIEPEPEAASCSIGSDARGSTPWLWLLLGAGALGRGRRRRAA